jgi:UDPglucose 6-dehydrogenase
MEAARRWHLGTRVEYAADEYAACEQADALVILTEWLCYRRPDWDRLAERLRRRLIFDGRNLYDPRQARDHGFEYYPIGRDQVGPAPEPENAPSRAVETPRSPAVGSRPRS